MSSLLSLVLGISLMVVSFCTALNGDYAKALWFLIVGLINLYITEKGA